MGYISKRDDNTYRLRVNVGIGGKRDIKSKTIKITDPALLKTKKRLADYLDRELARFEFELQAATPQRDNNMTLSSFIELWIVRHVDRELEVKSQLNYKHHITRRILPRLGYLKLGAIDKRVLIDFFDKLHVDGLGAPTVIYIYRVLRSIFNYAVKWDILATSPMTGISKPREPERRDMLFYDERELAALFDALQYEIPAVRCVVMLAVTCGLRRGEIAGLEWKHIDFRSRAITIAQSITANAGGLPVIKAPKTRRSYRTIAAPHMLIDELTAYRGHWENVRSYSRVTWPGEFLFCHESGQPHDPHWITDKWIALRERHGLKAIRFHDLRHTAATWMIKQNVHPKAIAARLGHVNIKTTMDVYSHVLESVDRAAADVFDSMPNAAPRGALLGAGGVQNSQTNTK